MTSKRNTKLNSKFHPLLMKLTLAKCVSNLSNELQDELDIQLLCRRVHPVDDGLLKMIEIGVILPLL